jgi:hypothetical protein
MKDMDGGGGNNTAGSRSASRKDEGISLGSQKLECMEQGKSALNHFSTNERTVTQSLVTMIG